MSDYTPTVVSVRAAYVAGSDPVFTEAGLRTEYRTQQVMHQEFDRWLAEHDNAVRTRWEMNRRPDPIIIENIQGEPAAAWMERQRREAKAEAWDEAVAMCCQMLGAVNTGWRNPYREES